MLGILFMILKIIGIILLCILGLFFVLILLALFVPVPYRIYVNGDSGEPETFVLRVKIFGVQVFPKKDVSGKERRTRKKRREEEKTVDVHQTADRTEQKKPKKQTHQRAPKSETAAASGKDIRETLKSFYSEFTDEGNRHALRHLLSEIRCLLRHFGPRRVRADVCFSLGDPANTGYATAAFSMCPFSYGKNCHIIPDFEADRWYVRGWLDMRGHGRAVHLAAAGLRLLLDRDVRKIIGKTLKKK